MLYLLPNLGLVSNLVYRVNSYKCLGVGFAYEFHQLAVFVFIHNGNHFSACFSFVGTYTVVKSCTAVQTVNDVIYDFVELGGNDANTALDVEAKNKVVR